MSLAKTKECFPIDPHGEQTVKDADGDGVLSTVWDFFRIDSRAVAEADEDAHVQVFAFC